jgi:hypothetical protein
VNESIGGTQFASLSMYSMVQCETPPPAPKVLGLSFNFFFSLPEELSYTTTQQSFFSSSRPRSLSLHRNIRYSPSLRVASPNFPVPTSIASLPEFAIMAQTNGVKPHYNQGTFLFTVSLSPSPPRPRGDRHTYANLSSSPNPLERAIPTRSPIKSLTQS